MKIKTNKMKNETLISYINRIIKQMQKTKIYYCKRIQYNLIQVDYELFKKYMLGKKYDMFVIGNNRICLDINNEGRNKFTSVNIYIPNNVDRNKLAPVTYNVELNILYRWVNEKARK